MKKIRRAHVERALRRAILAVVIFCAGAACGWSILTIVEPLEDPLEASQHTFVSVEHGEVGDELQLNAAAHWTASPAGADRTAGTVTTVNIRAGEQVSPGSLLYTVDLRPVAVAQGEVPAFRSIQVGVEGADVKQLQGMLASLGLYKGAVNGRVTASTSGAIRAWQRSLGVPSSGVVELGDVIFVPELPSRITLGSDIKRGATLVGGEEAVLGLPPTPGFSLAATRTQAAAIPADARVVIDSPQGGSWEARIGERRQDDETDSVILNLYGADEGPICRDACALIPVDNPSTLPARVVVTESTSGLVVPSSALVTEADGRTAVVTDSGNRSPVEVVVSAQGMSIITGVKHGTRVRVPGQETVVQ